MEYKIEVPKKDNKVRNIVLVVLVFAIVIGAVVWYITSRNDDSISDNNTDINLDTNVDSSSVELDEYDLSETLPSEYVTITLTDSSATSSSNNVKITDNSVTITTSGDYLIEGSSSDMSIIVDTDNSSVVHVYLNNVSITSKTTSCIYVKNAEKVVLTALENTSNFLTDGSNYEFEEGKDTPDTTIFAKDDLTINGKGKLTISSNFNDAIDCKDDLKILNTNIEVSSVDDGIKAKDLLYIQNATIKAETTGDGIKTTYDSSEEENSSTDTDKANMYLMESKINLTAKQDGISSNNTVSIKDCEINITTGDGSSVALSKTSNDFVGFRSDMNTSQATSTEDTTSMKAIKATNSILIDGGKYTINSQDDAMHSNNTLCINSGEFEISSGDDGIHADSTINISGGNVNITKSYEGIEASNVVINGGNINVVASDDGINVAGGNDSSAMIERPGQNAFTQSESSNYILKINGGNLYVNSTGDGLDSNGSIEINGGVVIVDGPTDNGNGALDYDSTFNINGGTVIAAGSSGMFQSASSTSKQNSISVVFDSTNKASTIVNITDSDGNEIITYEPSKNYSAIVISTPSLEKNKEYTLNIGGSYSGDKTNGLYSNGKYSSGTNYNTFTLSDVVTSIGNAGQMNNMNMNQGMPNQNQGGQNSQMMRRGR